MFSLITTNPKSSREELSALTEDNVEHENDSEHQIVCQKSFQTGEPAIICDVKPSGKYQHSWRWIHYGFQDQNDLAQSAEGVLLVQVSEMNEMGAI